MKDKLLCYVPCGENIVFPPNEICIYDFADTVVKLLHVT